MSYLHWVTKSSSQPLSPDVCLFALAVKNGLLLSLAALLAGESLVQPIGQTRRVAYFTIIGCSDM